MKKLIFCLLAAVMLAGCQDENGNGSGNGNGNGNGDGDKLGSVTSEVVIENRTESEIVVEYGIDDREVFTIESGETQVVYSHTLYHGSEGRISYILDSNVLGPSKPEMTIDGEIIPESIWLRKYWESESTDVNDPWYLLKKDILTVDDTLLERVRLENED